MVSLQVWMSIRLTVYGPEGKVLGIFLETETQVFHNCNSIFHAYCHLVRSEKDISCPNLARLCTRTLCSQACIPGLFVFRQLTRWKICTSHSDLC
ncbi:hypothetical protein Mapa_006663 [Marchantia paleacea]|nr:hypothetical protein Mapa_006663 [Marchantia paleacea]